MAAKEIFSPLEKKIGSLEELEACPHCGAPLLSRHARRQHLTLHVCQGGLGELDGSPRDHIVDRMEPVERGDLPDPRPRKLP